MLVSSGELVLCKNISNVTLESRVIGYQVGSLISVV